jgi:hypothetical protein
MSLNIYGARSLIRLFRSNRKTRKVAQALGILPISSILSMAAMVLWSHAAQAASFSYDFDTGSNDLNVTSYFAPTGDPNGPIETNDNNGVQDGKLRLTSSGRQWQRTSAWQENQQAIANGFETTFQFQISDLRDTPNSAGMVPGDKNGNLGGDGFAFVLQNNSANAISDFGGGDLGYGSINKALAIEFDTWDNSNDFLNFGGNPDLVEDAETSNHISVQGISAGDDTDFGEFPKNSLGHSSDIPDLSSGETLEANIRYESNNLEVFLNDAPILDVENINLTDILSGENAWVGFTGATGGSWQNQDISDWSFKTLDSQDTKEVPEPTSWLAIAGISSIGIGSCLWYRRCS